MSTVPTACTNIYTNTPLFNESEYGGQSHVSHESVNKVHTVYDGFVRNTEKFGGTWEYERVFLSKLKDS